MKAIYKTKSRDAILDYAKNISPRTFSAKQMYQHFLLENINVGETTVYRNLERMVQEGQLLKYNSSGKKEASYQFINENEDCHNHLHLKCNSCGQILHLDCELMQEIQHHLLKDHSFTLFCDGSVLSGLCKNCSDKKQEKTNPF